MCEREGVCVRERERENGRKRERGNGMERDRKGMEGLQVTRKVIVRSAGFHSVAPEISRLKFQPVISPHTSANPAYV